METQEIHCALMVKRSTAPSFSGVYPIDKIPSKENLRYDQRGKSFIIINLDPSYKTGSHWVAVCINLKGCCEYFDSYGREPPRLIAEYLGSCLKSTVQFQSLASTTCGQWCVIYVWYRCKGATLTECIENFKKTKNDAIVNKLFNDNFVSKKKQVVFSQEFWVSQFAQSFKSYATHV